MAEKSQHEQWLDRCVAQVADEAARGLHDEQCEYGRRTNRGAVLMLCHCHKRKREKAGLTKPPTEDLYFPPPNCPNCHEDLTYEDGWYCYECALSWDSDGSGRSCAFFDDYGDITEAEGGSSDVR